MAVLRLANGSDLPVKLSMQEVSKQFSEATGRGDADDFVELPGEDGPVLVRPSGVIAVIEDSRRNTAGFRIGATSGAA